MIVFLLQALLLIAIAFLVGAIVGCLLRRMMGAGEPERTVSTAHTSHSAPHGSGSVTATAATAATAATGAAAVAAASSARAETAAPSAGSSAGSSPRAVPPAEPVAFEPAPARPAAPAEPAKLVSASGAAKPAAKSKAPGAARPKTSAAPKAAAAKPKASAPKAKPVRVAAASTAPDDLKLIVGIGPKNEKALNAQGINRFAQIAAWSAKDQAAWGDKLEFPGRVEREEWVAQAKRLASGAGASAADGKAPAKGASGKAKPAKAAALGKPDNLTLINGIGNAIEKKLNSLGVFRFEQIAAWTSEQADKFSLEVGFPGRVKRENWIGEAKIFAKGGSTAHARRVEKGEVATSRQSSKPKPRAK
jgi:predicted flap endonuclease-1-like 5' DNA nuclease